MNEELAARYGHHPRQHLADGGIATPAKACGGITRTERSAGSG
jgi:hypothetical protein